MLFIGLSGKFGSGKDYIGRNIILDYIKKKYNLAVNILNFADLLKLYILNKYSLNWTEVYPPEGIQKSEYVRKLLQTEGQKKRDMNSNYWVDSYSQMAKLLEYNKTDIIITCDVRFKNEFDLIKKNGLICKVSAPTRTYKTKDNSLMEHISEVDLDNFENKDYDYIFNNDIGLNSDYTDFFTKLDQYINNYISK